VTPLSGRSELGARPTRCTASCNSCVDSCEAQQIIHFGPTTSPSSSCRTSQATRLAVSTRHESVQISQPIPSRSSPSNPATNARATPEEQTSSDASAIPPLGVSGSANVSMRESQSLLLQVHTSAPQAAQTKQSGVECLQFLVPTDNLRLTLSTASVD
jgi:hypothetical protein